jgi:hypothetical protein
MALESGNVATNLKDLSFKIRRQITILYANNLLVLKQILVLRRQKLPLGTSLAVHKPELLIGETAHIVSEIASRGMENDVRIAVCHKEDQS